VKSPFGGEGDAGSHRPSAVSLFLSRRAAAVPREAVVPGKAAFTPVEVTPIVELTPVVKIISRFSAALTYECG
jgi:hypothetical protein